MHFGDLIQSQLAKAKLNRPQKITRFYFKPFDLILSILWYQSCAIKEEIKHNPAGDTLTQVRFRCVLIRITILSLFL